MIVQIPISIDYDKSIYDAARRCWWADIDKAKEADYVLAVADNIVEGVFKPKKWHKTTVEECKEEKERCKVMRVNTKKCKGKMIRIRFDGDEASADVKERCLKKEIPYKSEKIVDFNF